MSAAGSIAVIGEAVADAFPQPESAPGRLDLQVRPGGGPANTAVALARLGTPTRFVGRLSTGVLGDLFTEHLLASRVDLSASLRTEGAASLAIAQIDTEGKSRYDFYLRGATDWGWSAPELTPQRVAGSCCVHTGSLALILDPGGPVIEELLAKVRRGSTVSVDPNVRPGIVPAEQYRVAIARWVRLADILRLSDEDLAVLRPDGDFATACAQWHAVGVRLVVLTRGASGAVASLSGRPVSVPAAPAHLVDTVGAGDSFTAGLLHSLRLAGHLDTRLAAATPEDVERAMAFAVRVAALTCSVRGADPPWLAQLTA